MDTVNFLAEWWGFVLILVSLAFLLRPRNAHVAALAAEHDHVLLMAGAIDVVAGIGALMWYHSFNSGWTIIVTLLNLLLLLKGLAILFFPQYVKNTVAIWKAKPDWIMYESVVLVLLGCILVYLGFVS